MHSDPRRVIRPREIAVLSSKFGQRQVVFPPQLKMPLQEEDDDLYNSSDPFDVRLAPRPETQPHSYSHTSFNFIGQGDAPSQAESVEEHSESRSFPIVIRRCRNGGPMLKLIAVTRAEDSSINSLGDTWACPDVLKFNFSKTGSSVPNATSPYRSPVRSLDQDCQYPSHFS